MGPWHRYRHRHGNTDLRAVAEARAVRAGEALDAARVVRVVSTAAVPGNRHPSLAICRHSDVGVALHGARAEETHRRAGSSSGGGSSRGGGSDASAISLVLGLVLELAAGGAREVYAVPPSVIVGSLRYSVPEGWVDHHSRRRATVGRRCRCGARGPLLPGADPPRLRRLCRSPDLLATHAVGARASRCRGRGSRRRRRSLLPRISGKPLQGARDAGLRLNAVNRRVERRRRRRIRVAVRATVH